MHRSGPLALTFEGPEQSFGVTAKYESGKTLLKIVFMLYAERNN